MLARGLGLRLTVGTVSAVEFFVALTASLTFLFTLGRALWSQHWVVIAGLAVGGALAAPVGAWLVTRVRPRPALVVLGLLVIGLSARTLAKHSGLI